MNDDTLPATVPGEQAFEPHDYAKIFPLLAGSELQELAADIAANGLLEDIMLYKGQILDGRGRLAACKIAGVQPSFSNFEDGDEQALNYVISRNARRRHMTPSQRSMVVAKIATYKVGSNQHSEGLSIGRASELMGISSSSGARAKLVIEHGDTALVAAVESDQISVSAAAELVRERKEVETEANKLPVEPQGESIATLVPEPQADTVAPSDDETDSVDEAIAAPSIVPPGEQRTSGNLDFRTPGVNLLLGAAHAAVIEVAVKIGATVSTGGDFPFYFPADRGDVIWVSCTSAPQTHLRPMFEAAQANLQAIRYREAENDNYGLPIRNFSSDVRRLQTVVRKEALKPRCIIFDHVPEYFRFRPTDKALNGLKHAVELLTELATEYHATILLPCEVPSRSPKEFEAAVAAAGLRLDVKALYVVKRSREQQNRGLVVPFKSDGAPNGRGFPFRLGKRDGNRTVNWESDSADLDKEVWQ